MADFISINGFLWEYETYGEGSERLLAFHGFGNAASDFKALLPSLGKRYKIIAFNLPYHGNSTIDASVALKSVSKDHLRELTEKVLRTMGTEKFSLMGYSLGGKIVLQLIELFPTQVQDAYLIAPDGIELNFSNAIVTRSMLGKMLYGRIIKDPSGLFRLIKLAEKSGLLNKKLATFVRDSLSTRPKRQMVWDVWMCFRDIRPSVKNVQRLVNENGIRMHLLFGKYDRIIPPSIGEKFMQGISGNHTLHIVETGHNLVKEKLNPSIEAAVGSRQ